MVNFPPTSSDIGFFCINVDVLELDHDRLDVDFPMNLSGVDRLDANLPPNLVNIGSFMMMYPPILSCNGLVFLRFLAWIDGHE